MLKKLFIINLFFVSLGWQSCSSATSQSSKSEVKSETPQLQKDEVPKQQNVNFKGVSFNYNPQIFGEVKSEEIAERPLEDETDKPDYVAPQHILFTLKKPGTNRETVIYVFPIEDYRRMYPISNEHNYREQFDEQLKGLQKVIKDKNYRKGNQIPFIPFWNGSQTFQKKVNHFSFQNGKGIFFLTQFDIETTLVSNEGLTYCFQGISNDGKNYILAKFPVSVSFLPKDYDADEFEGYKLSSAYSGNEPKQNTYEDYVLRIAKRLDNLKPNEFEPNLNQIEKLISSLKIEK